MNVYETLEYLNADGSVFKKRKTKNIGYAPDVKIFRAAVDGLQKKMEAAHLCRMNMVDRIEDTDTKVVIKISMVLNFEYDQRWTYELK